MVAVDQAGLDSPNGAETPTSLAALPPLDGVGMLEAGGIAAPDFSLFVTVTQQFFNPPNSLYQSIQFGNYSEAEKASILEAARETFTITQTFLALPASYTGPVDYITYQYIGTNSGEILIGTRANDFLNAAGGDDAINAGAGDDVIDGGTGSNFITGGAGHDVFFLDGRGGATTWSTITDWQAGEELSLFGWRTGVSTMLWVPSSGAAGYTGVTLHADLNSDGIFDVSVTWSGLTQAQLPVPHAEFDGLLWFI